MIIVLNAQHLARTLRTLRERAGLSRRTFARRLFVAIKTVANRELGVHPWDTDGIVDAANIVGYDLALIPQPRPDRRSTGTGWPT